MAPGTWQVRLTAAAERDYQSILSWTAEQFGEAQARNYAAILTAAILALSDGPDVLTAKPRDDIAPGLRILHAARFGRRARHMLLYRVGSDTAIDVLRILHDAMDVERHDLGGDG
ncbi:type II toxin-antitoxin system RelE/ParE family toxin [Sphingomonas sp. RT2P30]|uniref:type II toxin-antitoxin system RelE/ParE family toxin n=1 Tax=Parasphingomonas halimpatiens TaxID=3096162 RepID=UPI002FC597B7